MRPPPARCLRRSCRHASRSKPRAPRSESLRRVGGVRVGDALGIAYENLSPRRVLRLFPDPTRYHLLPSVGLISDDAEQAMMTLRALACSGGDPARFQARLATELRVWLATLPAGIGLSTARAGVRLWLGMSPQRSGVRSAGNAPALRGAILGVALADDPQQRETLVRLATQITHADPKAEAGRTFAPTSRRWRLRAQARRCLDALRQRVDACPDELREPLRAALASVDAGQTTEQFALSQGWRRGVSGYIVHTAAATLHAWLRFPDDFVQAAAVLVRCGGDTDSTAALLGIWMGAHRGGQVAPDTLIARLKDPLARPDALHALATATARAVRSATPQPVRRPLYPLRLGRNLLFLALVIVHLLRRALPPY
jgi:ADP-ribosyl-[dinitrogen reductase] hydrolase